MNPIPRSFARILQITACLVASGGGTLGAAQTPSQAADPAVELPKFTVTDNRWLPPPESWRHAEIPGFEVLSNASDRATERLLREFQLFHTALQMVWPVAVPKTAMPAYLILCGGGNKFDEFVAAKRTAGTTAESVLPDDPAGAPNSFLKLDLPGLDAAFTEHGGAVSVFLRDRESAALVLDLQARTVSRFDVGASDAGIAAFTPSADPDEEPASNIGIDDEYSVDYNQRLYREYIHFVLSRLPSRPPAWLEEGLSQLFMNMRFTRDSVFFAEVENAATISSERAFYQEQGIGLEGMPLPADAPPDFPKALSKRRLLSFDEFFNVPHDSMRSSDGFGIWAKQSQAFVHMCLYGRGQRYVKSFVTFVERSQKEPATEALFADCFQKSYSDVMDDLQVYVSFTDYKSFEFYAKGQQLPAPEPSHLREATPAEVGRIKGEAFRLTGNLAVAHATLITPYLRGERDPQLLASIGLREIEAGRYDRARKFLEAAAAAKAPRPRIYYELARLRLAEIDSGKTSKERLTLEQTAAVLAPLRQSTYLDRSMPEIYQLMGEVWDRSAVLPKSDDLKLIERGVVVYPRDTKLIYQAAFFYARAGFAKETEHLLQHASKIAADPAAAARLGRVRELLPATRGTPKS